MAEGYMDLPVQLKEHVISMTTTLSHLKQIRLTNKMFKELADRELKRRYRKIHRPDTTVPFNPNNDATIPEMIRFLNWIENKIIGNLWDGTVPQIAAYLRQLDMDEDNWYVHLTFNNNGRSVEFMEAVLEDGLPLSTAQLSGMLYSYASGGHGRITDKFFFVDKYLVARPGTTTLSPAVRTEKYFVVIRYLLEHGAVPTNNLASSITSRLVLSPTGQLTLTREGKSVLGDVNIEEIIKAFGLLLSHGMIIVEYNAVTREILMRLNALYRNPKPKWLQVALDGLQQEA